MMVSEHPQMVLTFPQVKNYRAENFIPLSSNELALKAIQNFPSDAGQSMVIYGESGVGKTHLLKMWCEKSEATYINLQDGTDAPFDQNIVVIDGLEFATQSQQEQVFHLFNHMKSHQGALLIASAFPAAQLELIPELSSRLLTGAQIEVELPQESELQMLLLKWANDRQVELDPTVVSYLMKRVERSPAALMAVLDRLDHLSLVKKKRITVSVAREVIEGGKK